MEHVVRSRLKSFERVPRYWYEQEEKSRISLRIHIWFLMTLEFREQTLMDLNILEYTQAVLDPHWSEKTVNRFSHDMAFIV